MGVGVVPRLRMGVLGQSSQFVCLHLGAPDLFLFKQDTEEIQVKEISGETCSCCVGSTGGTSLTGEVAGATCSSCCGGTGGRSGWSGATGSSC